MVSQLSPSQLPAPFDALTAERRASLDSPGTRRELRDGEHALEAGVTAGTAIVLLSGELVERDAGSVTRVIRAPATIGLSTVLAQTHARELRARGHVVLLSISADTLDELQRLEPAFARAVSVDLAHEIEARASMDRGRAMAEEAGPFVGEAGWLPPGPYRTSEHDVFAFFLRDASSRIAARLPPNLRPLPGLADTWLLMFHAGVRKYPEKLGESSVPVVNEVTALVPCLGPMLRPALYIPAFYTEGLFSLLCAREVHGLPARPARIERQPQSFDLFARGELLAAASWQVQAPLDITNWLGRPLARFGSFLNSGWAQIRALGLAGPRAALSSVPLFVHQKRPRDVARGTVGGEAWATDQLVQVPLHLSKFETLRALGDAKVTMAQKIDGLGGTCVAGVSARMAISWGGARDRVDYRRKKTDT